MRTVQVDVKQKHIDNGEAEDCESCPIALALLEQFNFEHVEVYNNFGSADGRYADYKFNLPIVAQNFIADFDEERPVKPFSFSLDLETVDED